MHLSQSIINPATVHFLSQRFHLAHLDQGFDLLGHDHAGLIIEGVLLQPFFDLFMLAVIIIQEVLAKLRGG